MNLKFNFGFRKKKKNNNDEKYDNNKIIYQSIEELIHKDNTLQFIEEDDIEIANDYIGYNLPSLDLITDEKSKNIIHYINKIRDNNSIMITLGKDENKEFIESIDSMPNLLIGGTVMSGKTAFINTIIASILLTKKPNEVKLVIFDSKGVDYKQYEDIPHLLTPIITNQKKLDETLRKLVTEIESRYERLKDVGAKNIDEYNIYVEDSNKRKEKILIKMPSIVLIIDDFSSFNNSDSVNYSLENITSKGWKVGIFVILSSNHPSTKVISMISKANFPARISFKVTSSLASKIIIDEAGAEKIKGFGSALYTSRLTGKTVNIKTPYITDEDINRIADYTKKEQPVSYDKRISMTDEERNFTTLFENATIDVKEEPLYNEIVEFVVEQGKASSSLIQRRFRLGYNRAARVMDLLEERGIVGPPTGSSRPRDVLVGITKYKK